MKRTFYIATGNRHKAREIRDILGAHHDYVTLAELPGAPGLVEDADSFAGNALKKARALAAWLGEDGLQRGASAKEGAARLKGGEPFVLADDSGLEVDALHGAPGIHSARFAALDWPGHTGNAADQDNNRKLLRLLEGVPQERRGARFRCVLALVPVSVEEEALTFEGTCEGRIGHEPRGVDGFGYDPLFVPDGEDRTFAELGEGTKNRISHRSQALAALKRHLEGAGAEKEG